MKIYLVGGAVRDALLNRPVVDKDYVVVGATEEAMLAHGYQKVGKDFPVFIHQKTGEEYALARTERKKGSGYYGFEIFASPDVTLEEDLQRRDLTINAMAQSPQGELIDPFNGKQDLNDRVLRHVSPAFAEDPLRVLRVARFAARYHNLGFQIADETMLLMKQICQSNELNALSAERVWQETVKALGEGSPEVYFETLRECGGLSYWFAEIEALWGIPNPEQWHPEIDTGVHTMMVLQQSVLLSESLEVRFAALCHDLGKAVTPEEKLPSHPGHEKSGIPLIGQLCARLKTPKSFEKLAKIASEFHLHLHRIESLRAATIVKVLERSDAFRQKKRFEQFLLVCEADYRGRAGFEDRAYPQADLMREAFAACRTIKPRTLVEQGFTDKKLGEEIHRLRILKVQAVIEAFRESNQSG